MDYAQKNAPFSHDTAHVGLIFSVQCIQNGYFIGSSRFLTTSCHLVHKL